MESKFTGGLLGMFITDIKAALIIAFTLGIATPWAVCMKEAWYANHTIVDGHQLTFDGKGGELFGQYIKWMLLTIVTFGIYSFWLSIKMKEWVTKHTHMA